MIDLFMVYQFVRRLATPFEEWDAFEQGIIDKNGNILKSRKDLRTREEKNAFGVFDVMILNIKKLLEKIPGGKTRIASYAAALYLLKEWNHFTPNSLLVDSITDEMIQESVSFYLMDKSNYIILETYVNQKMHNFDTFFEDAPTVNVGSGAIAGLGVGPDGQPGKISQEMQKHKSIVLARYKKFIPKKKKEDKYDNIESI